MRARSSARRTDYTGERFGRLVAIEADPKARSHHAVLWRMRCDCGALVLRVPCRAATAARNGRRVSCGCASRGAENSHFVDLCGARFGALVVTGLSDKVGQGATWICKCDCGAAAEVRSKELRNGTTRSCGCFVARRPAATTRWTAGIPAGERFGILTVIAEVGTDGQYRHYRCRCDCGAETVKRGTLLRNGQSRSCGCLRKQAAGLRSTRKKTAERTAGAVLEQVRRQPEGPRAALIGTRPLRLLQGGGL